MIRKPLEQKFFSTGCTLLDCVLGGGYGRGRIVNIVGDSACGKSLLAIEACANFVRSVKGAIRYVEAEAAFDLTYAEMLGLPIKQMEFVSDVATVEDLFEDLTKWLKRSKPGEGLYVLDSLDSLTDREEQGRKIDEGTYGANKAKQLSQVFRRLVRTLHETSTTLIIISQVREKIGVVFGKKYTRSGGKALDFYASQILWLADIGKLIQKVGTIERPIGIKVRAKCEKNKVGIPYRTCDFPILFNYGVENLSASVEWLIATQGEYGDFNAKNFRKLVREVKGEDRRLLEEKSVGEVIRLWNEIELKFLPQERKYL